jgi:hypothetical protein
VWRFAFCHVESAEFVGALSGSLFTIRHIPFVPSTTWTSCFFYNDYFTHAPTKMPMAEMAAYHLEHLLANRPGFFMRYPVSDSVRSGDCSTLRDSMRHCIRSFNGAFGPGVSIPLHNRDNTNFSRYSFPPSREFVMEALAAISLVSHIIQFVEVGSKVVGGGKEIYTSKDGMTNDKEAPKDAR